MGEEIHRAYWAGPVLHRALRSIPSLMGERIVQNDGEGKEEIAGVNPKQNDSSRFKVLRSKRADYRCRMQETD